jgi:hypothetical protein
LPLPLRLQPKADVAAILGKTAKSDAREGPLRDDGPPSFHCMDNDMDNADILQALGFSSRTSGKNLKVTLAGRAPLRIQGAALHCRIALPNSSRARVLLQIIPDTRFQDRGLTSRATLKSVSREQR